MEWLHLFLVYQTPFPCIFTEMLVIFSSELIVRLVLKEKAAKKHPIIRISQEFRARVLQLFLLVLLSITHHFLFYLPCLLVLCQGLIIVRLFVLKCCKSKEARNISKRLTYSGNSQVNTNTFSFNHKPGTQGSVKHRYSSSSRAYSGHLLTPQQMPPFHNSISPTDTPINLVSKDATKTTRQPPSPTRPFSFVCSFNYPPLLPVCPSPLTAFSYSSFKAQNSHPPSSSMIVSPWANGLQATHKDPNRNIYQNSPRKLVPPGILNTGNMCFLNSSIQCLAAVEEFLPILTDSENQKYNPLIVSLRQVLEQTYNWQVQNINPTALVDSVSKHAPHLVSSRKFGKYQLQQDAGEFLLWLLDILHMAYKECKSDKDSNEEAEDEIEQLLASKQDCMKHITNVDSTQISAYRDWFFMLSDVDKRIQNIRDMSPIYRLFCGQLLEARECQQCRTMSVNLEYHTVLPLPVPERNGVASLTDCFALFGEVENLSNDSNMLLCSRCSENEASSNVFSLTHGKRLALFSTLPKKLIILLSRFSYNNFSKSTSKKQSPITFPVVDLDLTPFTMESKLGVSEAPHQYLYDLTAFCVHTGAQSTSHGHYIAYSKVKDGSWYQFNDDYVTFIQDVTVEIKSSFVSKNAYILFYSLK